MVLPFHHHPAGRPFEPGPSPGSMITGRGGPTFKSVQERSAYPLLPYPMFVRTDVREIETHGDFVHQVYIPVQSTNDLSILSPIRLFFNRNVLHLIYLRSKEYFRLRLGIISM